jgi:hypothetical protein
MPFSMPFSSSASATLQTLFAAEQVLEKSALAMCAVKIALIEFLLARRAAAVREKAVVAGDLC